MTIVTNAGGPGVLATDALITGGGELAPLSPETMDRPECNSCRRSGATTIPIDVLGDAAPDRYAKALEDRRQRSRQRRHAGHPHPAGHDRSHADRRGPEGVGQIDGKPLLASWMGGAEVAAGEDILNRAGIPTFRLPRHRRPGVQLHVALFLQPARPVRNARRSPTPMKRPSIAPPPSKIINAAKAAGTTLLDEFESKQLLAAYGIPVANTEIATTADEAVQAAEGSASPSCSSSIRTPSPTRPTSAA